MTDKANAADPLQDPTKVKSEKAKFGPLSPNWLEETPASKCMCSYKVVTIKVAWWGLQTKAENWLIGTEEQIFLRFHKQLICWMDEWFDLSLEDVLAKERAIYEEMNKALAKEGVSGSPAESSSSTADTASSVEAATSENEGSEKKKKKKHRKHKGGRSGHHGGSKHHRAAADDEATPAEGEGADAGGKKSQKKRKAKAAEANGDGDEDSASHSQSVSASVDKTEDSEENGSASDSE